MLEEVAGSNFESSAEEVMGQGMASKYSFLFYFLSLTLCLRGKSISSRGRGHLLLLFLPETSYVS